MLVINLINIITSQVPTPAELLAHMAALKTHGEIQETYATQK
jgi:hypothetical protein